METAILRNLEQLLVAGNGRNKEAEFARSAGRNGVGCRNLECKLFTREWNFAPWMGTGQAKVSPEVQSPESGRQQPPAPSRQQPKGVRVTARPFLDQSHPLSDWQMAWGRPA